MQKYDIYILKILLYLIYYKVVIYIKSTQLNPKI